jgi:hypothetical protein
MAGTRSQAGKAQPMQQVVHSRQGILDSEFLLENPPDVFGPQGANAVAGGRTGQEAFAERRLFLDRQLAGAAGLSFGTQPLKPPIAVRIRPQLYPPTRAGQHPCDRGGTVAFQGQQYGSIPISLFGVPFLVTPLPQLFQILRMMGLDPHG